MKVIFLDFDGVLNSDKIPQTPHNPLIRFGSPEWLATQFDTKLVARLNFIIEKTGACVVLSTSWREAHPLHELCEAL